MRFWSAISPLWRSAKGTFFPWPDRPAQTHTSGCTSGSEGFIRVIHLPFPSSLLELPSLELSNHFILQKCCCL